MVWRYVVSRSHGAGPGEDGYLWEVRELYPSDDGTFGYTENAVAPQGESLDELLRDLDHMRSDADGVPAFVVLSNKQLEGIAAAMPVDERALLACNGIGPTKLERYGEDILAVLATVR